jgi:hypothetical protein
MVGNPGRAERELGWRAKIALEVILAELPDERRGRS